MKTGAQLFVEAISVFAVCAAALLVIGDYSLRKAIAQIRRDGASPGFWGFMTGGGVFLLSLAMGIGILFLWGKTA